MKRNVVQWRSLFAGGIVRSAHNMLQKLAQERRRFLAARSRAGRAAYPYRRQRSLHRVGRIVVELLILFGAPLPVSDIRLVPNLPVPARYFLFAVLRHAVFHPLIDELRPFLVITRWLRPS